MATVMKLIANTQHRFPKKGLRHKFFISHLTVALFGFVILIAALFTSFWLGEQSKLLASAADPIRRIELRKFHNTLEKTSLLTFEYMTLPSNTIKKQWEKIWDNEIWPMLDKMTVNIDQIDEPISHFKIDLKRLTAQFEIDQWQVMDVRNDEGNFPTDIIIHYQILPLEEGINFALNTLVEHEAANSGTNHDSYVLKQFADLRATFIRASISLHRYAHNAESAIEVGIRVEHNNLKKIMGLLRLEQSIPQQQIELIKWLDQELRLYFSYTDQAIQARKSPHWNIAKYLLSNNIQPRTDAIDKVVNEILNYYATQVELTTKNISTLTEKNLSLSALLLLAMILVAYFTAQYRAKQVMRPIENLVAGVKKLTNEQGSSPLPVNSDDELGMLTKSFNQMQKTLLKRQAELQRLASTDPLTKLANRRTFTVAIEKEWKRCMRHKKEIAVIMLDVDYFKQYNDKYGHQAGDDALVAIAEVIHEILNRPSDLGARYGGEEFIILLPETSLAGADQIASKIRQKVNKIQFPITATPSKVSQLSISCGVACCSYNQISNWESLVKLADEALYQAKLSGRNRVIDSHVA